MVSRKMAIIIELTEFFLFVIAHVIYAAYFFKPEVTRRVFFYAMGTFILAIICLTAIKNLMQSQTGFIICIMLATHLIGREIQTLAFGICIYMVSGALISIIGNMHLNIRYIIMVNLSIAFGLIMRYSVIVSQMRIEYYVLMILFCEAFLFTENYMVILYQRKVEEVEIQNILLNTAQKSKNEFLANMSHEIRTPMNAIIGMSELIMRENDASEKIKEYCYNIQSSGDNLLGIINDILDFSKIESGKMDIMYEPYSIASVIQDVLNAAMFRRGFKDVNIIVDCSPGLPKQLFGDVLRNRQILMNLVSNAVKFTEEGYVYILISCHEKEGENWLELQVKDTGIGIQKEDQVHIFESFSRVDAKRNHTVEGTGLGLAICKRLVQAMHGSLKVYSEYGEGTTMVVDIPQKIADASPFLTLKEKENVKIALYGDKEQYQTKGAEYYKTANERIWKELDVPYQIITSFLELMKVVEDKAVTHLFIGAGEYMDQRSYFEQIARCIKIFVLYDPQYPLQLGENIHGVHMPFYSINLVSALNGEAFYNQYIIENEVKILFKAPFARVLIVDDNEINLRVAEGVMKLYDINCVLAKSGTEAIELLKDQDIDLVLMDHMMPEMDGIEAANIIRRTGGEYGKKLPIIALTANVVNGAKEMFLQCGFQDFLAKPMCLKETDVILRKWIPGVKIEVVREADRKQVPVFDEEFFKETIQNKQEDDAGTLDVTPMVIKEEAALKNMGGQRDLYKELLEYSLELEGLRKKEISESFEQKKWHEYMIRVHGLKGGMRSLGVEELAVLAQKQELACKEERITDVVAGHTQLMVEYDRAHRSIEHYLSTMEG